MKYAVEAKNLSKFVENLNNQNDGNFRKRKYQYNKRAEI